MIYSLEFDRRAVKERKKLAPDVRSQFKKKLAKLLNGPHIEANKLRQLRDCYKIKLRSSVYRLIYQVVDRELVVLIIAIGERDKGKAYSKASKRVS